MRKSSPTIDNKLKIESSKINKFPDIQKVLTNHSRGSAYMRHFLQLPILSPNKRLVLGSSYVRRSVSRDLYTIIAETSRFPR